MLNVKRRELVVPGELVAEGDYLLGEGLFRDGREIYSSVVGLVDIRGRKVRVIPLQGRYVPKPGDKVIGIVIDAFYYGWILDLNSPYTGTLFASDLLGRKVDFSREDLSEYLEAGDAVFVKVKEVDELMHVSLEADKWGMGKLKGGKLVEISSAKIPRVIGRGGSMISMLQGVSGCRLRVGQNGRVMVWGRDLKRVNAIVEALLMIEREAHTTGLTDRVREFLEKRIGGK